MNADEYIQKLLGLSVNKFDALKKILNLTEKQNEIITEDSIEELNKIIGLKQEQMNIIDELDQAFEVYYSRLKSMLGVQSLEEIRITELNGAAGLQEIITSIYDLTKQIEILEISNNKKAKDTLDKLSSEIRQIKQGKMVNNGYNIASKLPQQSYYFDKKK